MKKLFFVVSALAMMASHAASKDFHDWAATPPMGWNSWDFYGTAATEAEMKMQADAQAKELAGLGWTLCTLDITWYDDHVGRTHGYNDKATLELDAYGRLIPGPNRFPSSVNGAGFKPLADYLHARGLTFGIHIMRGIARQAVKANSPIKGADGIRAQDIANTNDTCCWNPHMYGVDMKKPGAQAYYDSLLELYASWGVDFIKCDDISRPYSEAQALEIEALRKAIDACGRPIVLSLSPGDTPISANGHVENNANMWRISDDFWDDWRPLKGMFGRLHKWEVSRVPGAWPDADMLPFGNLQFGRKCRFTQDEQRTCMTLWCIARSPLILGGDMTALDEWTRSLLLNPEVIKVNQQGSDPRQLYLDKAERTVWVSDAPEGGKYVAMFNTASAGARKIDVNRARYTSLQIGGAGVTSEEVKVGLNGTKRFAIVVGDDNDGYNWDHAGILKPTLTGPKGSIRLETLKWKEATAEFGQACVGKTTDGKPLDGIGTHARSTIVYELPAGYDTLTFTGALVDGCEKKGTIRFMVCTDEAFGTAVADRTDVTVDFAALGLGKKATVRDLWARKDLGTFEGEFTTTIKTHASGLYLIR